MKGTGTVFWVHLAGAGSLAGWVALAVVSHRMERPLPLFLGVMAWEWLILLAVWRVLSRGDGERAFLHVLAWSAAFLLCGLFATPVMEEDHFRFLWDGRQFATTGNPYAKAPATFSGNCVWSAARRVRCALASPVAGAVFPLNTFWPRSNLSRSTFAALAGGGLGMQVQ